MTSAHARRIVPPILLVLLAACETKTDVGVTDPMGASGPSLISSNFTSWSTPVDLGPPINTSSSEVQPAVSRDGLTLYFSSNRPETSGDTIPDANIWVSQRACTDAGNPSCAWRTPQLLRAPVNSPSIDAAPGLSRDEHWLFFTTDRQPGSQERDIYVAYRANVHDPLGWESAANLGPGINSAVPEIAPSYFENDEEGVPQLFFNRGDRGVAPGGDIYISRLSADGTWSPATEVKELNSAGSDQRPSIKHNGLEIYFWSNRTGANHIWQSTRESVSDAWSPPTLVGSPINDKPSIQPFIHSHGRTETLFLVRNVATPAAPNFDIFMSTRTRVKP